MGNAAWFGPFRLDLRSGELSGNGTCVRLQDKPLRILMLLLEHPGEVVLRDELRRALWTDGTFVDFEHGLNMAMRRLRAALGDSARTHCFIETLPRRGYRWIAAPEESHAPATSAGGSRGAVPPRKPPVLRLASDAFKARCLELVDRVRRSQTEIIVTRNGRPVARLVPADGDGSTSPRARAKPTIAT